MPKYLGNQIFSLWRLPKVGQKQIRRKKREKKKKDQKVGNNNGQLRITTPPRVAHAKPPGTTFGRGHLDQPCGSLMSGFDILAQVALSAPPEVALQCVAGHCFCHCSVFLSFSLSFSLFFFFLRFLLLTHFGESPMCEIIFHPIFWHN